MRKVTKVFLDIKKEQDWLASQKGWKLINKRGLKYMFEKSDNDYVYEYVFFEKRKKELPAIKNQIQDKSIEFVCSSSSWALFRKDASKGSIQVYMDNQQKYKALMKKYSVYISLGACYMALGSSQLALSTAINSYFGFSAALFFFCSSLFFFASSYYKKYAKEYK